MTLYAVLLHDRWTEDDPPLGSVIRAEHVDGPWHHMVTGDAGYCWEIVETLQVVEDQRETRRREADDRLRAELERERTRTSVDGNGG